MDKKSVLLRLSPLLYQRITQWAESDFRSVNAQIEYILTTAAAKHFSEKNVINASQNDNISNSEE